MNVRERFLSTMRFEPVDRLPMVEWANWWDKTLERWKGEGLRVPAHRPGMTEAEAIRESFGHYDKMVMPHGEKAMRAEFERLMPVMRQGGYAPSVDHQTPPGVSLDNYRIYLSLFREYAEKAAKDQK